MLKHDFIIWLKKNIFEAFQHSLLDIELILPEMSNIAMMQKLCGLIGVNTPLALVTVITHNTNTDIGKFLSDGKNLSSFGHSTLDSWSRHVKRNRAFVFVFCDTF